MTGWRTHRSVGSSAHPGEDHIDPEKAIFSGEYASGQELSLTEAADRLGVSRTPVREAFQALAAEGLITLRMNKGAIVNRIDRKFIRDNFEMRILLESVAARRAAENGMNVSSLLEQVCQMRDRLETLSRGLLRLIEPAPPRAREGAAFLMKLFLPSKEVPLYEPAAFGRLCGFIRFGRGCRRGRG